MSCDLLWARPFPSRPLLHAEELSVEGCCPGTVRLETGFLPGYLWGLQVLKGLPGVLENFVVYAPNVCNFSFKYSGFIKLHTQNAALAQLFLGGLINSAIASNFFSKSVNRCCSPVFSGRPSSEVSQLWGRGCGEGLSPRPSGGCECASAPVCSMGLCAGQVSGHVQLPAAP